MAASPKDRADLAEVRLIAFVIAGTMIGWMFVQYLGGQLGWPPKYVFLADLAAIAAFFWALVATYRIWRKRQG
ncbi:MAG: DUF5337 domain-containing protein [Paracoccaceae bacterium]